MNALNWCLFTLWVSSWSEPFTEKIIMCLEQEAGSQMATRVWICVETLCSLPLACSSVCITAHCLDCCFVVVLDSEVLQLCSSVKLSFYFWPFVPINFTNFHKSTSGILIEIALTFGKNWYLHNILSCSMNMVCLYTYLGVLPLTSVMFVIASDGVENVCICHVWLPT